MSVHRHRCGFVTLAGLLVAGKPCLCAHAQVNLPPGFEIVEFAVDEDFTGTPDINDCGEIVIYKRLESQWSSSEVYRYDNGAIVRITNNADSDVNPQINNLGQILWGRGLGNKSVTQLILYQDGQETILDEFKKSFNGRTLNNLGHVAWTRSQRWRNCPKKENIFFWDGQTTQQLTRDRELSNVSPSLNDHDEMAWELARFCQNPWASDIQVQFPDARIQIPSPDTQNAVPAINNLRWVVWTSETGVLLWIDSDVQLVARYAAKADLNSLGRIFVPIYSFQYNSYQPWVFDVLDADITAYRLHDKDEQHLNGAVNTWGECVWSFRTNAPYNERIWGISYLRRIRTGDGDFDGDINLTDHQGFATYMSGPVRAPGLCENRFLDIDYDGDLDLADFARLQNAFTGASP